MAKRRHLREAVIQYLYFWEISRPTTDDLARSIQLIWEAFELPDEGRPFCESLIIGTLQNLEKIDKEIAAYLQNWDFARVQKADLTILRLALYEFYFRPDIPPIVTINEAVDLAKAFSSEESGKFINGILDKIAPTLGRPLREAVK